MNKNAFTLSQFGDVILFDKEDGKEVFIGQISSTELNNVLQGETKSFSICVKEKDDNE